MKALLVFLALTSFSMGQTQLPSATHANVRYGNHERHVLDFWQANPELISPLLIFIHGGGWSGGEKTDLPLKLLDKMLRNGISVASINYRYTSMAIMPAPLHDAAQAVQFLRQKAGEWKIDAQRLGGYGISAGACMVLWLALHDDLARADDATSLSRLSTRLQVAVGLSPPTILEPEQMISWVGDKVMGHPAIPRCVGMKSWAELRKQPELWRDLLMECSVLPHLSVEDPPFLLSFPRMDPLPAGTPSSAIHHAIFGVKLKEKADAAGVTCVFRLQDSPEDTPTPEEFLIDHLKKP